MSPIKAQPPLLFGSAIHAALATYYDPTFPSRSPDRAYLVFHEYLDKWFASIPSPDIEDEELWRNSQGLGRGMLEHYFRAMAPQDDFEVLWVEREFIVPLFDDAFYTLQPDAVIRDKNGRVWIMEHKTEDKMVENREYLLMDEQCGSYLAGLKISEGIEAEGVLYNILRKKIPTKMAELKNGGLSQRKDADTTYEYALADIKAFHEGQVPPRYRDFLENLRAKGNKFFYRENVRRSRREIEFLWSMVLAEAKEMLDSPVVYRNPTKFNCSFCAFVGPCLATYEGADVEQMLEGNYQKGERH